MQTRIKNKKIFLLWDFRQDKNWAEKRILKMFI